MVELGQEHSSRGNNYSKTEGRNDLELNEAWCVWSMINGQGER